MASECERYPDTPVTLIRDDSQMTSSDGEGHGRGSHPIILYMERWMLRVSTLQNGLIRSESLVNHESGKVHVLEATEVNFCRIFGVVLLPSIVSARKSSAGTNSAAATAEECSNVIRRRHVFFPSMLNRLSLTAPNEFLRRDMCSPGWRDSGNS